MVFLLYLFIKKMEKVFFSVFIFDQCLFLQISCVLIVGYCEMFIDNTVPNSFRRGFHLQEEKKTKIENEKTFVNFIYF